MSRLPFPAYRDHLVNESRRFRDVLAQCDPAARVPGCPDWNAADLLWHLTGVHLFWGAIVTRRPTGPQALEDPVRPEGYDALLSAFDSASSVLVAALDAADPGEPAWTWSTEQTVGFTFRRQAHEALIHRLDAEQTAGAVTGLDQALAADGVEEALAVMFGGCPPWGAFTPDEQRLRVHLTDTEESIWVQLGHFTGSDPDDGVTYDEGDLSVISDPGVEPDAVVAGSASDLDSWLWRRRDDEAITFTGDRSVLDRFLAAVNQPIN